MTNSTNVTLYVRTFRHPFTRVERFRAYLQTVKAVAAMIRDAREE